MVGKMKKRIFVIAILSLFAFRSGAEYILSYNAIDGSLTINATGDLSGYSIDNSGNNFIAAGHTPPTPLIELDSTGNSLSAIAFTTSVASSGNYNIGSVLPSNLTETQFNSAISGVYGIAAFGSINTEFEMEYVPEPSSMALLGIGALLLIHRTGRSGSNC